MRVAELSRGSGVPVPTIKYYLREGLLPSGERTSPNQVQYGDEHLRRLRLIRALADVGGLSIGQVRDVLIAVDSPDDNLHKVLGMVQEGITVSREATDDEAWRTASQDVDDLITGQGWQCSSEGAPGRALTAVLVSLRELGHHEASSLFETYVRACAEIAEADLRYMADFADVENMIERMVVGTVLGDAALVAIRRLAHEHASAIRYAERENAREGRSVGDRNRG